MTSQFLGIAEDKVSFDSSRVVVIPVPFEASVCFGKGTSLGPDAIIEASAQVELFDAVLKRTYPEDGIFTLDPLCQQTDFAVLADQLTRETARVLASDRLPVVLGGEHSVAVPAVAAFAAQFPGSTVIHIDAHADLRDTYQNRKWSHACALRRIREFGLQTISIGIRSMSDEEADLVRDERIFQTTIESPDFWPVLDHVFSQAEGPAWLTFDVDGFDPSVIPSTGTPEPGGLNWLDVMRIFGMMKSSRMELKGADFVELAPIPGIHHPEFTIAKLIHRFILLFA